MAQVNLEDALEGINATTISSRRKGLDDLKHILRHNRDSSRLQNIGDRDFHYIFDTLFQIAIDGQSALLNAKSASSRSTAANRLSDIAGALRMSVEAGVRALKGKTVGAVLDHVTGRLFLATGDLCDALALDYAKTMHAVLSYKPHVEQMKVKDWDRLAAFCSAVIKQAQQESLEHDPAGQTPLASSAGNGLSYLSSRSTLRDTSGSQTRRSVMKPVAEEMVACLRLLTAAPNAPRQASSTDHLWTIINALKTSAISHRAHPDAFGAINNILSWLRTEGVRATQKATSQLLRLVKQIWSARSSALVQMLTTLLFLRPFISRSMHSEERMTMLPEVSALLHTIHAEYSSRTDKSELKLDDLRFEINRGPRRRGQIAAALFSLRCNGTSTELNWALVNVLAFLRKMLLVANQQERTVSQNNSSPGHEEMGHRAPKRQRLSDPLSSLLELTARGTPHARICALQTLTFLAQQYSFSPLQLLSAVESVAISCSEDNVGIASWALLAAASCAAQPCACHSDSADYWNTIWQLGVRSLGNNSTCRAACYVLALLLAARLVAQAQCSELIHTFTHTMELHGPAQLSDAATLLLGIVMRASQQSNPTSASATADSITNWLSQTFRPSKFEEKYNTMSSVNYEASDVMALTSACLDQPVHGLQISGPPVWEACARAWLSCEEEEAIIAYLLLEPVPGHVLSDEVKAYPLLSPRPGGTSRLSTQALTLSHYTSELGLCRSLWKDLGRAPGEDAFTLLCKAAVISMCLSQCFSFKDLRRQAQLHAAATDMFNALGEFARSARAEAGNVAVFLSIFSTACSKLTGSADEHMEDKWLCERAVCHAMNVCLSNKQPSANATLNDDALDFEETSESQQSHSSTSWPNGAELMSDLDVTFGRTALRMNVQLYTTAVIALGGSNAGANGMVESSKIVVDFLLSLGDEELLACRSIMIKLSSVGISLTAEDTERLLVHFMETLKPKYAYRMSEVYFSLVLDFLQSFVTVWCDSSEKDLFCLGIDTYDWFAEYALKEDFFSANVQYRLAQLFLQLCQARPDYGRDSRVGTPRTCCFKLLSKLPISVHYKLADRIPILFGRLVLSEHARMFNDLEENLPTNTDWMEGMAIRLLHLSKLGASWRSLLRSCTWLIFEAAGRVEECGGHARKCVQQLSASLSLQTPQNLFSLFASQLLFTWLDTGNAISQLPWGTFHYASLHDLLRCHRTEAIAQLVLRGDEPGLELIQKALKLMPREAVRQSYAKCVAYCIAQDVVRKHSQGEDPNGLEHRLRDSMGDKEQHKRLIREHLPTIVGYVLLSTEQDVRSEKWLTKHNGYNETAEMLAEMTRYTRKEQDLPPALEPSFSGHYLMDQLIRLCKRVGRSPLTMWDPSSFVLTARMLLNAIDLSLGSLQCCRVIRRVMIVVAMAGRVALDGFGPEMLIQALRPFVSDGTCANDAIGLLRYLFNKGREYLQSALRFSTGAIILLVLQMRKHSRNRHDSTTQESHHSETVEIMLEFQTWLVDYLRELAARTENSAYDELTGALAQIELPGNAMADSAESCLLLFLLSQWNAHDPLCSREDIMEALQILAEDFGVPSTPSSNCMGKDELAVRYSQQIWEIMMAASFGQSFTTWAADTLGRAYAATGARPGKPMLQKRGVIPSNAKSALLASHAVIVARASRLMYSQARSDAGLAEHALRKVQQAFVLRPDAEEAIQFQEMTPGPVFSAIYGGLYGYEPIVAVMDRNPSTSDINMLREAMAASDKPLEIWATDLAVALSSWATKDAVLSSLATLLRNVPGLAIELLPQMLHVALATDHEKISPLLSDTTMVHLRDTRQLMVPKQQFFLRVLLYLRSQSFPGEATRDDRLRWLEIDYMVAAHAATRCAMPTAALLLAESTGQSSFVPGERKHFGRSSTLQGNATTQVPPDLLLDVYKNIEEPDSFYGVAQEPSLHSVLERLNHEGDGFRSMMFRSAQMDSHMRATHQMVGNDAVGMVHSLSTLNFDSLAYALVAHGVGTTVECAEQMLRAAQNLQQWDLSPPESRSDASAGFGLLQELSRANNAAHVLAKSQSSLLEFVQDARTSDRTTVPSHSWFSHLACLTEINEVCAVAEDSDLDKRWDVFQARHSWMHLAKFEDVKVVLSSRHTLFGVIGQNVNLQHSMHITPKRCRTLEIEALLAFSRLSREHMKMQEALTATTTMSDLIATCATVGSSIDCAVKFESASVLWDMGELGMSVKMLLDLNDSDKSFVNQDIPVGRAGLLAQIAYESAEARLEKPEHILSRYLKPALSAAAKTKDQSEASKVHFEFARFCDQELQSPSSIENLSRLAKQRQDKQEEVEAYKHALQTSKKTTGERHQMNRSMQQAQTWLEIDTAEENRLRKNQSDHVNLSLQNYLQALAASDEHDICVLRFFALWLEHTDGIEQGPDATVLKYLPAVPSWKFVRLMNQLMSRLDDAKTPFQQALSGLLQRIFVDHPYHSLHHLFAPRSMNNSTDPATISRYRAAKAIHIALSKISGSAEIADSFFRADSLYKALAENRPETASSGSKIDIKHFPSAAKVYEKIPSLRVPPATITLPLRSSKNYGDVPIVTLVERSVSIMNGLSAPKMMKIKGSDGKLYRELYKSGDDDLRQDAIMEQVFEEVSAMLRNHKATRQRDLKLRTYKVIPLSSGSGIIEFVPNSVPINDFLNPAHRKYHPKDITNTKAREMIARAYASGQGSTTDRIAAFQKVCAHMHPVMRHFFLERFDNPDDWFAKRTAYARTTASISILGHIIGLGDRHCSNILLDEHTGEIVHIDLGVAFEAGRVLPIPELVPFRLTRDIVDGMGATGVEGVFRRCCEFTLDAVREDKDSIMTLLNVLRYDPLHNWTISPLRAKRMQEAQSDVSRRNGVEERSSKRKQQEAGEADRALSIVEKKLSTTLSTTAAVNELIQQASDEKHLAVLFAGWAAYY